MNEKLIDDNINFYIIKLLGRMSVDWEFKWCFIKDTMLNLYTSNILIYNNRVSIDILVCRKDVKKIEEELIKYGFVCENNCRLDRMLCLTTSYQLPSYKKIYKSIELEININFDILWGEYEGERINIADFISNLDEVETCGYVFKVLSPSKAIINLVLHYYADMNSIVLISTRESIKYRYFRDFYNFFKSNEGLSEEELYDIAFKYKILPYVYYIFYYTGVLFKDERLEKFINTFKTPEGEKLLISYGLCSAERREWKVEFGTRLEQRFLYDFICDELTDKDLEKIRINKRIFG